VTADGHLMEGLLVLLLLLLLQLPDLLQPCYPIRGRTAWCWQPPRQQQQPAAAAWTLLLLLLLLLLLVLSAVGVSLAHAA